MERLSRAEVMRLTPEERIRIKYYKKMNAERVKKHRENNKHALGYNREYKNFFINRDENKEKYRALNRQYLNKHNENKAKTKPK